MHISTHGRKKFLKTSSTPLLPSGVFHYIRLSWHKIIHISFRKDSDISTPYGRILEKNIGQNVGATELQAGFPKTELYSELSSNLSSKTGSVLWLASHCWTDSRREDYVKELDKHLTVSVIGSCAKVANIIFGGKLFCTRGSKFYGFNSQILFLFFAFLETPDM